MKQRRTTEELDALLGRGGLGATRRDSVLEAVLESVKAERPSRVWWRWSFAGLGAAAAATAALFLLLPRPSPQPVAPSTFRAKGLAAQTPAATPAVEIECSGGPLDACPSGSLLLVRGVGVRGFVAAWAEPVGGGERIWYFSADTSSPRVDGIAPEATSPSRAVRIGPEHKAGAYVVETRITDRPLTRAELLHLPVGAALAAGRVSLSVTSP
jgi:hypothetical protein